MKIRRLKISQQLTIVFFVGVFLPLCIAAWIVININQHAVRAELTYSAILTAGNISQRLEKTLESKKLSLLYIAKSLDYIVSQGKTNNYLQDITDFSDDAKIEIISHDENLNKKNKTLYTAPPTDSETEEVKSEEVKIFSNPQKNTLAMYAKLQNGNYLRKFIYIENLKKDFFKNFSNEKRDIYILDLDKKIVMSYNGNSSKLAEIMPFIPKNYRVGEPFVFSRVKNEPNVFLKLDQPDWAIIVSTPKQLTHYGIIDARIKILLAIFVAAFSIIIFGILYTYSLNTNLVQLFKTISALGKGNYRKKARLVKDFFTPIEIVFLFEKFNSMAEQIDITYVELNEANKKLSKLDKLKSNLIDTVSHEFRTPLTCIKGYTSRLLRHDISISEEMRIKSLKVIKQQTERLIRLVDDLLVAPQIESELLRVFPSEVDLRDVLDSCIHSIQQKEQRTINIQVEENMPTVWADPDRTAQVFTNLLENAIKYSVEDSEIDFYIGKKDGFAFVETSNKSGFIPGDKLYKLFDKFVRIEDASQKTSRGTGLGLFIVRGLVHAMGGEVSLLFTPQGEYGEFKVSLTLPLEPTSR